MPKKLSEKTASGHKNKLYIAGACIAVLLSITGVSAIKSQKNTLTIKDKTIATEIAATPEERSMGLSGRDSLGTQNGMLFLFDNNSRHCFWMKDMKFAIDVVWLNEQKQIVHIEKNLDPITYPQSFCPPTDARYVLEVNAGKTTEWSWGLGDQASF